LEQITAIIVEQPCQINNKDVQILEQEIDDSGVKKVIFKARLQTAEEKNQNQRYYKKDICQEIVNILKPKAHSRSLFQEVDHPIVNNDDISKKRAITVELKNSGTLIRDIYMDKLDIIGEIETLSGFRGPDIYNLVVNDKANIGFSLRMFARVVNDPKSQMLYVEKPLRPITYDIVSNPSHKTATILEFLPEDVNLIGDDSSSLITEDIDEFSIRNNINIIKNTDTRQFVKQLLEHSYNSNKFIRFKI